ncbi:MAG: hypothetical protein ACEPOW_06080, partial [Bacteroidales bacterium]
VFIKHEIWTDCQFTNTKPSKDLLPKRNNSGAIVLAFRYKNWEDYYNNQQNNSNITEKKQIATIVAITNGWIESNECPEQRRLLFSAKNYYLAVDTQHSTFEVYNSPNSHLGEIFFNDSIINTDKKDKTRKICN